MSLTNRAEPALKNVNNPEDGGNICFNIWQIKKVLIKYSALQCTLTGLGSMNS